MDSTKELHQNVFTVHDAEFKSKVLDSKGVVLVDFWATWCPPCRTLSPVIDSIAGEYADRLVVYKMDVDDNAETAAGYHIESIPTVMIFKDGKLVDKFVGSKPKGQIAEILQKHFN